MQLEEVLEAHPLVMGTLQLFPDNYGECRKDEEAKDNSFSQFHSREQ